MLYFISRHISRLSYIFFLQIFGVLLIIDWKSKSVPYILKFSFKLLKPYKCSSSFIRSYIFLTVFLLVSYEAVLSALTFRIKPNWRMQYLILVFVFKLFPYICSSFYILHFCIEFISSILCSSEKTISDRLFHIAVCIY